MLQFHATGICRASSAIRIILLSACKILNLPPLKTPTMKKLLFVLLIASQFANAQELALVSKGKVWGYINRTGAYAIPLNYTHAKDFSDGLAAVEENGKWGFIDPTGKMVIPAQYDEAKYFNSGICVVAKDKKWFYIDKKGTVVSTPPTEKYYDFEDGIAFFKMGDKVGIINTKGVIVLNPIYESIKSFEGNYARVKQNGKWGVIDKTGKVIVEPAYDDIGDYSKTTVWAQLGETFGLVIGGKFQPIAGCNKIWDFNGQEITYARKDKKVGFIDMTGKWVIEPKFDKARSFSKGLAPVQVGDKWGYINPKGEFVIQPSYPDAEVFSADGLAPVKIDQWGFVNTTGQLVIPAQYEITAGLAFLTGRNQKGFINGLARIKKDKKWGFIDTKGNLLGNMWFENAEPFSK